MDDTTRAPSARRTSRIWAALRMLRRLVIIGVIAVLVNQLIGISMDMADQLPAGETSPMQAVILLTALIVYALLIATPFVPGVEIGLALLLLRGASIAPAVYSATLAGLLLAYLLGRFLPDRSLARFLLDLRLRRAGRLVHRMTRLSDAQRETRLERMMPPWLSLPFLRYRYLSLALLLNLPGNVVFGGGGGLMLMAGLSRLFRPRATIFATAIAVLPVPLMIWWFGTGMFGLPPA